MPAGVAASATDVKWPWIKHWAFQHQPIRWGWHASQLCLSNELPDVCKMIWDPSAEGAVKRHTDYCSHRFEPCGRKLLQECTARKLNAAVNPARLWFADLSAGSAESWAVNKNDPLHTHWSFSYRKTIAHHKHFQYKRSVLLPDGQQATPPIWQAQKWANEAVIKEKASLLVGKGPELGVQWGGDASAEEARVIVSRKDRGLHFQRQ